MRRTWTLSLLAGAATSLGGAAFADAPASSNADEVRALVAEMLADAETRTSLLQGGMGGHDGRFYLSSADGNFRLETYGQIQFRYILNMRDDSGDFNADGIADDDFTTGFQTRRTKVGFKGHVFGPDLFYNVRFAADRDGGDIATDYAYVGKKFDNGWTAQWGQFKAPLLREELVGSDRQLAVERSFTNEIFTADYVQGIMATYEQDNFRFMGSFNDGISSANTDLTAEPADFGLTARVEFIWDGSWSDFKEFTSARGNAYSGMFGAAIHYQDGPDDNDFVLVETEALVYTLDFSLRGDGWNAFVAFVGNNIEFDATPPAVVPGADSDNYAFILQAGVMLSEDWELFGRYEHVFLDDDVFVGDDEFNAFTIGLNNYIHGHAAKFSIDLSWYFEPTPDFGLVALGGPTTSVGALPAGDEDQVVIRAQYQLLF